MLITFEGIEGSGKSTQLERLSKRLSSLNIPFIVTKEPGGTAFGTTIRNWLLHPDTVFSHPYSEILLFVIDRLEHVESVIKPALLAKKLVLCDRYKDSTIAYQQAGRKLDPTIITLLNKLTPLEPDLTLLYDCSVSVGLKRAKSRAKLDRFENETLDFHQRIADAYRALARREPQRFKIIDANASIDTVEQDTMTFLSTILKKFQQ